MKLCSTIYNKYNTATCKIHGLYGCCNKLKYVYILLNLLDPVQKTFLVLPKNNFDSTLSLNSFLAEFN